VTADKLIAIVRDVVCLALGTFGFIWQVTHGAELVLMTGCILVISGPAVMRAWAQGRTPDSPSSPASPAPSPLPPSPSPSSYVGGGEP
jgi:hypothetical protein